jgi:hypothetical protein
MTGANQLEPPNQPRKWTDHIGWIVIAILVSVAAIWGIGAAFGPGDSGEPGAARTFTAEQEGAHARKAQQATPPVANSGGSNHAGMTLSESLPKLRQHAPTLSGYSDKQIVAGAAVLCADMDAGQSIMSILGSVLNRIRGIDATDAGAYLAFSVDTFCPKHIDEMEAWAAANGG